MNLGIDFGSTYSSFATFDRVNNRVELCRPSHGESEAVPSVACLNYDGELITGHEARNQIRTDPETESFEAFKMLLTSSDRGLLQKRGYNETYTPRKVAEEFLSQQVSKILSARNEEKIENLVVCIPEVWTTKESVGKGMLDGRNIILDICRRIGGEGGVQVVSEPAAVSAFFAHQSQMKNRKRILVIDYGGGTLDLTLTEVNAALKTESSVEIKVLDRTGAGANTEGRIGDAGIAYMEAVVQLAVAECGDLPELDDPEALDPKAPAFRSAFQLLESKLKGQATRTSGASGKKAEFRLYDAVMDCIDDIENLKENNDTFEKVLYGRVKVDVTFSQLYRAYESTIRDNLDRCLKQMCKAMDEAHIDYQSSRNDEFNVILAGGFGKFILVQNQVEEFFEKSQTGDKRFYDLGADREYAVAKGAALLADKIITIRQTAPYSIGILSYDPQGNPVKNFAITYRQEIDTSPTGVYWIKLGEQPKQILVSGRLNDFLIGYDTKGMQNHKMILKKDLSDSIMRKLDQLRDDYHEKTGNSRGGVSFNIGFRIDDSEIVTLVLRAVETGIMKSIQLDRYEEMFEIKEI